MEKEPTGLVLEKISIESYIPEIGIKTKKKDKEYSFTKMGLATTG